MTILDSDTLVRGTDERSQELTGSRFEMQCFVRKAGNQFGVRLQKYAQVKDAQLFPCVSSLYFLSLNDFLGTSRRSFIELSIAGL